MTVMIISVSRANDQLAEALLDDESFYVGLSWNESGGFWTLSIRNYEDTMVCSGLKLLPNAALLVKRRKPGVPKGELFVFAPTLQRLSRESFDNNLAVLAYINQQTLLNEGLETYEDIS